MNTSDGLLRVFWPYDLPRSSAPGVIVGWRNSELDLFVLTVLEDVEVRLGCFIVSLQCRAKRLVRIIAPKCGQCAAGRDPLSQ